MLAAGAFLVGRGGAGLFEDGKKPVGPGDAEEQTAEKAEGEVGEASSTPTASGAGTASNSTTTSARSSLKPQKAVESTASDEGAAGKDDAKSGAKNPRKIVRTGLSYRIGYAEMTSTGRGGAGNIYEASLVRERKRIEDEKLAKERAEKAHEEALRDVAEGLLPPQKAFMPGR